MSTLAERWQRAQAEVDAAARRAGRDPSAITIVAVTKKQPLPVLREALAAGVLDVGENYAQELASKHAAVEGRLRWHFIGTLQRNKVKLVVGRAALLHALDSVRLAEEIDKRAAAEGFVQPVLVAVNVAGEASKSGVAPAALPALLEALERLEHVVCQGLMTMPPLAASPEDNRRHFAALRELAARLATPQRPLTRLSMGTSSDYLIAVEEGATLVRIGTAIVGPRPS